MITLDDVILWLFKYETSHIRPDLNILVNKMRDDVEAGNKQAARQLQGRLSELAQQLRDEKEVNEILVESAVAASKLGEHDEAESLLGEAISRAWSHLHRRAVIRCMLGCVQWENPHRDERVVFTWREALTDLERLAKKPGLRSDQQSWYNQAYADVESSLIEALKIFEEADESVIDGTAADEPREQAGTENESQAERGRSENRTEERPPMTTADILQLFTVSDEIPAGDFGASGVDPFPIGTVEVDSLTINGKPYSIHNTRGKKIVNLPLDQHVSVVKVKGDSMDQENILPGDYVVVRGVDVPVNGDLVLAEITGIDNRATLKRFYQDRDTITLQPRSSNPEHQPFVFKNTSDGFHVRRVVSAILKPMMAS